MTSGRAIRPLPATDPGQNTPERFQTCLERRVYVSGKLLSLPDGPTEEANRPATCFRR